MTAGAGSPNASQVGAQLQRQSGDDFAPVLRVKPLRSGS
jgi:hypothetical protein